MFKGLSSPDELKTAWHNLTNLPENTLNVVWDFMDVNQLKNGCNVINSRYNPDNPNEIGHYCAIFKTPHFMIYYNPISRVMARTCYEMTNNPEIKKNILKHQGLTKEKLMTYPIDEALKRVDSQVNNLKFDLTGEQRINSNSCGFYCLAKLYDYLLNPKKMLKRKSK